MQAKVQVRDIFVIILISLAIVISGFYTSFAESRLHKSTPTPPPNKTPLIFPTTIPEFILGRSTPLFAPTETATNTPILSPTVTEEDCSIPPDWIVVEITADDTLASIADEYRTTVAELMSANCLLVQELEPDSTLFVPEIQPSPTP